MQRVIRRAIVAIVLMVCGPVAAQQAAGVDELRQGETRQQAIRAQAVAIAADLGQLISEFERNGLADGDDVRVLRAMQGVLGTLTQEQMDRVVSLLQQARGSGDGPEARSHVIEAYASQKVIIAQLKQLLLEYRRRQAMYDLATRFAELAERQGQNLKDAVALARGAGGKPVEQMSAGQKSSLAVQVVEQASLRNEATALLETLRSMTNSASGDARARMAAAMEGARRSRLPEALSGAATDLEAGNLFRAATHERNARDQLRELARLLARPKDNVTQLRESVEQLDRQIAQQREVADETEQLRNNWKKEQVVETEAKQADVVDQSDLIRRDLETVAPETAEKIKDAQDRMQDARLALNETKKDDARKQADEALKGLEAAAQEAREELARAERAQQMPADPKAALASLQEQVRELIRQQQALRDRTQMLGSDALKAESAKQLDLRRQTRDAQSQAATRFTDAAKALADASGQMGQAVSALEAGSTATPPQALAIESLQRAERLLEQELAQVEQKEKELAELEQSREAVAGLIEDQEALQSQTEQDGEKKEELARKQAELSERTETAREQVPKSAEPARKALAEAGREMNEAKADLEQDRPQQARQDQQAALEDLQQTQKQLGEQIAQLERDLGRPQDSGDRQRMDEVAQQLEQAQRDLGGAMEKLPERSPSQLQEEQQRIADRLDEMRQEEGAENGKLAPAQERAHEAAEQLAANNPQQAAQQMQQAQQAMEQAQQAMEQAAREAPPGKEGEKDSEKGEGQDEGQKPAADKAPDPAQRAQELAELTQRQAELRRQAEAMAQQQAQRQQQMEQAAQEMEEISADVADAAGNEAAALPEAAGRAAQQAADAMAQASKAARADDAPAAQQNAETAQQRLSEALAAIAMAQAGMTPQAPGPPGPPMPGQTPGTEPAPPGGEAGEAQRAGDDATGDQTAAHPGINGQSYIGLPERDRKAIQQSQGEEYPEEYAPLVEQYLRNLATQEQR